MRSSPPASACSCSGTWARWRGRWGGAGGALAGAIAGSGLGDPRRLGLDAMFPAAFLALLAPQLRRQGAPIAAVSGALVATALVPYTQVGVPILFSALGVIPGLIVLRRAQVAA